MTTTVRSNADGSSTILVGVTPAIEIAVDGKVSFPENKVPAFRAKKSGTQSVTNAAWVGVTVFEAPGCGRPWLENLVEFWRWFQSSTAQPKQ